MKKIVWILGILLGISVAGHLVGLVLLDKAMHYREKIRWIEEAFPNEGLRLLDPREINAVNLDRIGVFVGGGLPRHWFFPNDFPFRIANKSGMEESIATTLKRFDETVIQAGADFVLINAGFCDIYNAIQDDRDVLTVLEKNLDTTRRMVLQAKDHGILPIVTTLTPVRNRFLLPHLRALDYSSKNKAAENAAFREMNRRLLALSTGEKIPLIDFHKALCDEEGVLAHAYSLPDGEHIHLDGYRHLTGFLQQELERIFAARAQDP
ncbi:MAG: hypothetical protein KJ645_02735 [Planctomycetes bacterium]|nr:hypothetical protein [Planctomycetota bacterium]